MNSSIRRLVAALAGVMPTVERCALGVLLLSGTFFAIAVVWRRAAENAGIPSYDTYGLFYPNLVYAMRSLREGSGLFWNPYQDSGQAFFVIALRGIFYPVHLVFAVLDREPALIASVIINLAIAGAGAFAWCRIIGTSVAASLCGALAFQLGSAGALFASWSPTHLGPFVWLPVAMWLTERLIRQPGLARGLLLGVALSVQLTPGFPQTVWLTYQLVALRLLWAVVRREARLFPLLGAAAAGLVSPAFLTAVQLLPTMELTRESVRELSLALRDLGGGLKWPHVRDRGNPLPALTFGMHTVVALIAVLSIRRRALRGPAVFYLIVAAVYAVLSLGYATPLFALYARLPLASTFRRPDRLIWVAHGAAAVLTALGAQALLTPDGERAGRSRAVRVGLIVAGLLLLHVVLRGGAEPADAMLAAALVGAVLVAGRPRFDWAARALLPVVIFVAYAVVAPPSWFSFRHGDLYTAYTPLFGSVRARLTPQDRVLLAGSHPNFALMPKSASLFRLPHVFDYEPLAPRTYVEFFTFMRLARRMTRMSDWYWVIDQLFPDTFQRRLLDLTAVRYLVVGRDVDRTHVLGGGLRLLSDDGAVRIYENEQALPRARYVPRLVVAPEWYILGELAGGDIDLRRTALVSEVPPSGFFGADRDATGSADIVVDEAERVVVRVRAAAPGFLLLADQYFPGWEAEVNGQPREIVRANYTWRVVEVPAGDSEVAFSYRPMSVRVGAAISLASAAILMVFWIRTRKR